MTTTGRRPEQSLPEWAWLILVLVNSQCSGPDICAWMRQRRQSKRGDEAALCPSAAANQCNKTECFPGLMRPLYQNERGRGGRRGKGNFLCVAVVVSGLTVMDGADMSGWRKFSDYIRERKSFETTGDAKKGHLNDRKEERATETFWRKVREHCYCRHEHRVI